MTERGWCRLGWILLAGVVISGVGSKLVERQRDDRIVITPELHAALTAAQAAQLGRPPNEADVAAAVETYIRDEVLYREALRRGLDKGDPVLRRRLLQTMQFALEAEIAVTEPSEAELADFAADRPLPGQGPRYTFEHVFFGHDKHGDRAQAAAGRAIPDVAAGDPFLHGAAFAAKSQTQVAALFGVDFAAALASAPLGQWSPPVESAYGWHRVKLIEVGAADWRERRDDYAQAWQQARMDEAVRERVEQLRQRYVVAPND